MSDTQAEAVAKIALDMELDVADSIGTSKSILRALNRAYQAGWSQGYETANSHNFKLQAVINDLWAGKAP